MRPSLFLNHRRIPKQNTNIPPYKVAHTSGGLLQLPITQHLKQKALHWFAVQVKHPLRCLPPSPYLRLKTYTLSIQSAPPVG